MRYYNIHTHKESSCPDTISIVSRIVKDRVEEIPVIPQSAGIHPWYIYNVSEQLIYLRELAQLPQIVAIGEVGLDKLAKTPLPIQQEVFVEQARLAEALRKPLIIHCVKAWDELLASRKQLSPDIPWIIHGFRGNGEQAKQLIRQGFYLSFGAYFNSEAACAAWPNHLFTETDDIDIDIREVYKAISGSLSLRSETFALQMKENVNHVFSFTISDF